MLPWVPAMGNPVTSALGGLSRAPPVTMVPSRTALVRAALGPGQEHPRRGGVLGPGPSWPRLPFGEK